jgi:His-Xaa-Ser system protein HxsD
VNTTPQLPWLKKEVSGESISLRVDLRVYPLQALFATCYVFTDRCYLHLVPEEDMSVIVVQLARKLAECDLAAIAGEFSNELINQRVRNDVAAATKAVRDLIVAQAFAEADLLEGSCVNADYNDDPKGIAK